MTRRQCSVAGAVALTGLQIAVPVDAQSLVEVARLAQLARSRTTGAVRTYTQDDFPPSVRLATRQGPPRPTDEDYRALLETALRRERDLKRQLRETRAARTPAGAEATTVTNEPTIQSGESDRGEGTGGGIPLAIAYGSASGPLFYLGQPVRRSTSSRGGRDGRRGHGRGRAQSSASSGDHSEAVAPASTPAQRAAPARNGYAESSRPLNYVVPGIRVPRVPSRATPPGR